MVVRLLSEKSSPPLVGISPPPAYAAFLLPGFQASAYKAGDSLQYLLQHRLWEGVHVYEYRFFVNKTTTLIATTSEAITSLLYSIQGQARVQISSYDTLLLQEGYAYLLQVPLSDNHRLILAAGTYRLLHIRLTQGAFATLTQRYARLQLEWQYSHPQAAAVLWQKPGAIVPAARGELELLLYETDRLELVYRRIARLLQYSMRSSVHSTIYYSADQLERIAMAYRFIHQHPDMHLPPELLQKEVLLNAKLLKIGYKAMFGKTIYAHQLERRLAYAAELLAHSSRSVHAIAIEAGYEDHSSFSKTFRRYYSCSPQQYRQRHRGR